MTNGASHFSHARGSGFSRRPVLTAMMVYSLGVAAAVFIVWRGVYRDANPGRCEPPYLVRIAAMTDHDPASDLRVGAEIRGIPRFRFAASVLVS